MEKTMQVVALIHEEKGVFGVSFPDFPGCVTASDDLDSAVGKAAEALAFHAEGLAEDDTLPSPRTLSELANNPDFIEDSKGAVAVLVPYQPPSRAVRLNITLEESLLQRLDQAARTKGETRSGYIAGAVRFRMRAGSSDRDVISPEAAVARASRNKEALPRVENAPAGQNRRGRRPARADTKKR
jgi:predicted RNase H-like HicB family nuclease